jgi:Methyltransferase domain
VCGRPATTWEIVNPEKWRASASRLVEWKQRQSRRAPHEAPEMLLQRSSRRSAEPCEIVDPPMAREITPEKIDRLLNFARMRLRVHGEHISLGRILAAPTSLLEAELAPAGGLWARNGQSRRNPDRCGEAARHEFTSAGSSRIGQTKEPIMPYRRIDDLEAFKARAKATWMAGDYPRIARLTERTASEFLGRLELKPGTKVLDVACGSGNLAVPAARTGAIVTGVDIAPNLLDQARARTAGEKLGIRFEEGDAEDLPFAAGAFDVIVSMFGAMFAPRPEIVASELTRVCRPGGQIALASWTPPGFICELFKVTGRHVSPPADLPSPLLWGDETAVRVSR